VGWIIFVVVALIVVIVVITLITKTVSTSTNKLPSATYTYAMKMPLSQPEQILYHRLREALPECEVLPQVTFSRFLEPTPNPPNLKIAAFRKISQKSADYLICLKDFTIVAAVELDDSSHNKKT
jgi:carbon starvation protein CstA